LNFRKEDILKFAALSGDYNPVHLDPKIARRTIFGDIVLHGLYAALSSINQCFKDNSAFVFIEELKITFKKSVRLGLDSVVSQEKTDGKKTKIILKQNNEICISIEIQTRRDEEYRPFSFRNKNYKQTSPKEINPEDCSSLNGEIELCLDRKILSDLLPALGKYFCDKQLSVILATTNLVGMECPGLFSIFLELFLKFSNNYKIESRNLCYKVDSIHPHTTRTKIALQTDFANGFAIAAFRPRPVQTPSLQSLKKDRVVDCSQVRGLIIGGSRGIGAMTAKLIAVGGGEVAITYSKGQLEAEEVINDIKIVSETSKSFHFDVTSDDLILNGLGDFVPTHLFYFATPRIALADSVQFDDELFQKYTKFYVTAFYNVVNTLLKSHNELIIFYPSSSALNEILPKASEYSSAKASGEMLCKHLNKLYPNSKVFVTRLPRLTTDQTNSLIPTESKKTKDVMLSILEQLT
jgi:NADP-dependent 3-hydroxy acid dehydrogenase YdfG